MLGELLLDGFLSSLSLDIRCNGTLLSELGNNMPVSYRAVTSASAITMPRIMSCGARHGVDRGEPHF